MVSIYHAFFSEGTEYSGPLSLKNETSLFDGSVYPICLDMVNIILEKFIQIDVG